MGGQGSLLQQGLHESEGLHGMGGGRLMLFTLSEVVRISLDGGSWEVMVVDSIKGWLGFRDYMGWEVLW